MHAGEPFSSLLLYNCSSWSLSLLFFCSATMKRVAARLSRRGGKAKKGEPLQVWQGEQFSALDHEVFLATLESNKQQRSPPAKARKNSPQLRERRYVREMVVVGDDMLTGNGPVLHSISDLPDGEVPVMLAQAKASGMRFRSPSFAAEDTCPSPIEENVTNKQDVSSVLADDKSCAESEGVATAFASTNGVEDESGSHSLMDEMEDKVSTAGSAESEVSLGLNEQAVSELLEERKELESSLSTLRSQLENEKELNCQLRSEIKQLHVERADLAAMNTAADSAMGRLRDLEEEHRQVVPMLQAKLTATERRCDTTKRQNEQLALHQVLRKA